MKKQTKLILIMLCLLTILLVIVLASCDEEVNPPIDQPTDKITITVKLNFGDSADQTFTVDKNAEFVSLLAGYVPQNTNGLIFAGWVDGDGEAITAETRWDKDGTVTAVWKVTYTEQIYVEQLVDGEYVYVLQDDLTATREGLLGGKASMQIRYDESHYFIDDAHPDSEPDSNNLTNGVILTMYYSLERFIVAYDGASYTQTVRYGEQYTIRTPEDSSTTVSYCSSQSGYGREYAFGDVVTITGNLTLYPVTVEVYTDANGSGDTVEIRTGLVGLGSAVLVKDGVRYPGFVERVSESLATFDVTVRQNDQDDGVTYIGKLLEDGTFVYRNEQEYGTYLFFDPLFPDDGVIPYIMLALDGFGTGDLAMPLDDGTGRIANYYIAYEANPDDGDYYMEYFLPADPKDSGVGFFQIVRGHINGAEELEGLDIAGYFMLCGNEYGGFTLVYNGEADSEYVLSLDGYGNGSFYYIVNDEIDTQVDGIYVASSDFEDDAPEYVFYPDNPAQMQEFVFILFTQQNPSDGKYYTFFMIKRGEAGDYTLTAGEDYPELYLDGYGAALYVDSESDKGSLGSYTIEAKDGGFEVLITFIDGSGILRVSLDKSDNTFTPLGEFDIDENGVLTKYYGNSIVIVVPEGVKEIADEAFKDVNIATLTLPSTLLRIGDYAFQNSNSNGKSMLKTVYLNAEVPPELGEDPFRWVTSEFKIVVPNGYEETYRNDLAWTHQYPSATYADYITSRAEISNKPLYEVKDGVLISYNNKDEDPRDVAIVIPGEVTEIAARVFEGRSYITSVDLNNVTVIGASAFDRCVNLATVTFNANTVSIGASAFFGCISLTNIDLHEVQTIGANAFACCYNLTKVTIGSSITSIETQAFAMCAVVVDAAEEIIAQNELIVTLAATTAPQMANNVFKGSVPRIYVPSYEIGVSYAQDATANWALYAKSLRVKLDGDEQRLYSISNMGDVLVLGDRADYGEGGYVGLYKWQDGKLYIAWFERSGYDDASALNVIEQIGQYDSATGIIRGFSYDGSAIVLVTANTQVTYVNDDETLSVTFGSSEATFNGNSVTIEIVNYRMQFAYQGYVYKLTLTNTYEFSYTRDKIVITKSYTAADGSALTVQFGNLIKAVGTLKNVDGETRPTEIGWYITEGANGSYTWQITWLNTVYLVTATFNDADNTFTYVAEVYHTRVVYRDGKDYIVATQYSNGRLDLQFNFSTANGDLSCNVANVKAVEGEQNTYAVTITIMIDVLNSDGEVVGQEPSEFNGNYRVTLSDNTYTLTKID